ncbi:serine hydrolase domain-containing protein [Deminuibacter soli]|uniref:Class C beta-lactamase-related serine hydrolase n=1 Tax=Deminuibacter soli TaxID=2291815 RepID=A0A3E1NMR1_9BACT|nr:serine hydrolase [Deminuibacter soli]RFM29124.1 class C beta-lactamase-related serine hydrolase [Deminuibacter soli]
MQNFCAPRPKAVLLLLLLLGCFAAQAQVADPSTYYRQTRRNRHQPDTTATGFKKKDTVIHVVNKDTLPIIDDGVFSNASPESQGFSSKDLAAVLTYIKTNKFNVHSLLLVQNKTVLLDATFYPYRPYYQHDVSACAQTVTAMLIGIAIDKGLIKDDEQPVMSFFPEVNQHNPQLDQLKLKDLLAMRAGLDCQYGTEDKVLHDMFVKADWADYVLNVASVSEPGARFEYCAYNYYLLGEILKRVTKMSPEEFAKQTLFEDLKIQSYYWEKNDKGLNYGWGDLALQPHDLAKLGVLLLEEGKCNGKQVVSGDWIKKMMTSNSTLQDKRGYGYGVWINNEEEYSSEGRGQQRLFINKERNIIMVATGGGFEWEGIGKKIIKALKSDDKIPENVKAYEQLRKLENHLAQADTLIKGSSSPKELNLYNKYITLEKNSLDIERLMIRKDSTDTALMVTLSSHDSVHYPMGVGSGYKFYTEHKTGHLFASRAYWKNDNVFEIEFNMLSKINRCYIDFAMKEKIISITEPTHGIDEKQKLKFEGEVTAAEVKEDDKDKNKEIDRMDEDPKEKRKAKAKSVSGE